MTVREIARQAGVSAATVSRYFTGTEKVSEDVRCKIQSVLGDDVSSGKRSRHKNRLMVMIVPHMRLAFYQELMKRFMEKVSPYGIQLIFLPIFNSDAAQVRTLLKRLRPDGLVILEEPVTVPILDIAHEMKIPVVVCGETLSNTAMFAAITMAVLPSILVYVLLQEQVTGSLVAGSVKG